MTTKIKVQQYDNGIKLYFTIKKDGYIEPLNGATVVLKLKNTVGEPVIKRELTITDMEMAECLYILTSEDLSVPGGYMSEIETIYANGTILSQDNPIILTVTPQTIN